MLRANFPTRREQKRKDADERSAYRESLSLEARLTLCDSRPGESKRERARLAKQIALRDRPQQPEVVKAEKEPPKSDKRAVKARERKEKGS